MNLPNRIEFIKGQHKGLFFIRGTGPAERKDIGGGVNFLTNSTNFWYADGNRAVDAVYLDHNRKLWVARPTDA